jgi:hypothetical protein
MNVHYKGYREGPYGIVGKKDINYKIIHRDISVGQYVDQRGINTFAFKIPSLKTWKIAPYMDKMPRTGAVPRVVGTLGDDDGPISDELMNQVRGKDMSFVNPPRETEVMDSFENDTDFRATQTEEQAWEDPILALTKKNDSVDHSNDPWED